MINPELMEQAFARIREHTHREVLDEQRWFLRRGKPYPLWGRDWDAYNHEFNESLRGSTFQQLAEKSRRTQGQLRYLDIGTNHDPRPLDKRDSRDIVIGVALQEWRVTPDGKIDSERIKKEEAEGFFLVIGSIALPETWETIDRLLNHLHVQGRINSPDFNLVTTFLGDGWSSIPLSFDSTILSQDAKDMFEEWLAQQINRRTSRLGAEIFMDKDNANIPSDQFFKELEGDDGSSCIEDFEVRVTTHIWGGY